MSLLDDEEDLAMDTRLVDLYTSWNNFINDRLEIYKTNGLRYCTFLPKAGIIVPQDMHFYNRLKMYCSENNIDLFHLDCSQYNIFTKWETNYKKVCEFYRSIKPFSIVLIENITSLIDVCDQTTINYLIHSWKNINIQVTDRSDIITDQHLVIFTIDEANTDKIGKIWNPSDSYAWYGNIMDEE